MLPKIENKDNELKKLNKIREFLLKLELKNILDPETYIGLAVKQAQLIIQDIENKRTK